MRLDREARRTSSQFLNGAAVAMLSTLVIMPLSSGSFEVARTIAGIMAATLLHAAAIVISRQRD